MTANLKVEGREQGTKRKSEVKWQKAKGKQKPRSGDRE